MALEDEFAFKPRQETVIVYEEVIKVFLPPDIALYKAFHDSRGKFGSSIQGNLENMQELYKRIGNALKYAEENKDTATKVPI